MKKFNDSAWLVITTELLIIVMLLEVSDLGRDWTLLSATFDLGRLTMFLLALFLISASLALFIFRKRTYIKRIKIAFALTFFIYCIYSLSSMAVYYFGFNEPYNYFSAKRDLKDGKVQLLYAGQLVGENEKTEKTIDSLDQSYGITYLDVGIYSRGLERYNEVVEAYLEKKNGKNWKANYRSQRDSIRNANKALDSWP